MSERLQPQVDQPEEEKRDPQELLPLSPLSTHILLSLAESPKHGYGVIKAIRQTMNSKEEVAHSTAYKSMREFVNEGLLGTQPSGPRQSGQGAMRGDIFQLTQFGADVLIAEAERITKLKNTIDEARLTRIPSSSDIYLKPPAMRADEV